MRLVLILLLAGCERATFVTSLPADCPTDATLVELQSHRATLHAYLEISDRAGKLEVFMRPRNPECNGALGCVKGNQIRSNRAVDEHELIHAYLAPHARTVPLWREGLAVALDCGIDYPPVDASFDLRAWDGGLYRGAYGGSGALVAFLIRHGGIARFMQVYMDTPEDASPERVSEIVLKIYGFSFDDALAAALSKRSACIAVWRCAGGEPTCESNPQARFGRLVQVSPPLLGGITSSSQDVQQCGDQAIVPNTSNSFIRADTLWTSQLGVAPETEPLSPVAQGDPLALAVSGEWRLVPQDGDTMHVRAEKPVSLSTLGGGPCITLQACMDEVCKIAAFNETLQLDVGTYRVGYTRTCLDLLDPRLVVE